MDTRLGNDPPRRTGEHSSSAWIEASARPSVDGRLRSWLSGPAQDAATEQPAARISFAATVAIFAVAFLLPAWPWLSGHVTIPWDAKSQFFPQVQFLASSIVRGEWPWWTPNVFAGWPQISDPQSL